MNRRIEFFRFHGKIRIALALVILLGSVFLALGNSAPACASPSSCPQPAAYGWQPYPGGIQGAFVLAGTNRLASSGPALPQIYSGYPQPALVSPYAPCILLQAIAMQESSVWKQFTANYGQSGYTVLSSSCGYGIMQITSGMGGGGGFDPIQVTQSITYNIGTGALLLIQGWNALPNYIGNNLPVVVEDWYYAVWYYNGWGYVNNPNNPAFNPSRPPFDGTQPKSWYPFQELIWGYAANPPDDPTQPGIKLWSPTPLTLPQRSLITDPPPTHIGDPLPTHTSCGTLNLYTPIMRK